MHHEFDLAVWHGTGEWPGVAVDKLEDEEVFPICSPSLMANSRLQVPKDILQQSIIRTESIILADEWPFWMDLAGLGESEVAAEITTDYLFTSMQAAADGLGIALGRSSVVTGDLSSAGLIEPFAIRAKSSFAYHLVVPLRATKRQKIQLFRAWLLEEISNRC
jgi:LysR family glycine cleavage system transcriptional activator